MIKNDRQYAITRAQAETIVQVLDDLHRRPVGKVHPLLRKAEEDALRSQLADLQAELEEYDLLRSGKQVGSS